MSVDCRGIPTRCCPMCGHTFFRALVRFDEDYTIGFYVLDGECDDCGALVTLPTEIDHPDYVA